MQTIGPEEVKQRLERRETLHIIDVREDEEVAQGMIPGAKHIPLGQLPQRRDEIEQSGETFSYAAAADAVHAPANTSKLPAFKV